MEVKQNKDIWFERIKKERQYKTKDNWRRERRDSVKNEAKVLKAVIKDPTKTQREIAKEAGVSVATVNNKLNNLELIGTKAPTIEEICKQDIEIVKLANQVRKGFVEQVIDKVSLKSYFKAKRREELNKLWLLNNAELAILLEWQDNEYYWSIIEVLQNRINVSKDEAMAVDKISDTSHRRYSLFKGNATDDEWGLKQITELSVEDLWKRLEALNNKDTNGIDWSWEDWEGDN